MFVEIVITEEHGRAEALTDALLDAGALSASIEDADAGSSDEEAMYGEPGVEAPAPAWRRSRVVALFDASADIDAAMNLATEVAGFDGLPAFERREIADANWVDLTQSQFEPIAVGNRMWIVPSWHAKPSQAEAADAIVLRLDPGMAFGTGDHPTTRLCLEWLVENLRPGNTVIDYGCGSGILAIAAKKLGAGDVVGTDIDDQAIIAAGSNAADNAVDICFTSSQRFKSPPADIVVANILSNPLKMLAPLLTSLVGPNGRLVLSGILERQWHEVAAVYAPAVLLEPWAFDSGWVCLSGHMSDPRGA
jgi:ribosomal protein L11 methyltransferase